MNLLHLNNTEFQAAGLPLSLEAARFFWSLTLRNAAYDNDPELADSYDEFIFEAGIYVPDGTTRPVSSTYLCH